MGAIPGPWGVVCSFMSMMAADRYSPTLKPVLNVWLARSFFTSSGGIGWPAEFTAKRFSTSGVHSQFSFSWEGNSTKSWAWLGLAREA